MKTKKLTAQEMRTLHDPNSLLFFEMMYRCGDPFAGKDLMERNRTASTAQDAKGPAADTVQVAPLNGMIYVKMKTGSLVQVWLFDTGASDLLINTTMANGTVGTCRRYRMNNVQIGRFSVDNVVVSVSEKATRILVGKALLNKFRHWRLGN